MSKIKTEGPYTAEFLLTEANGQRSRDSTTITGGQYAPGQVLGRKSSGEYATHNPAASDGSQHAVAVLYGAVDAQDADQLGTIIARDAEVITSQLIWADNITEAQKTAALSKLAEQGIIAR